jgi:hypothetical protein
VTHSCPDGEVPSGSRNAKMRAYSHFKFGDASGCRQRCGSLPVFACMTFLRAVNCFEQTADDWRWATGYIKGCDLIVFGRSCALNASADRCSTVCESFVQGSRLRGSAEGTGAAGLAAQRGEEARHNKRDPGGGTGSEPIRRTYLGDKKRGEAAGGEVN